VPISRLDESAGRILQLKEDLGLFETPLPDPNSPLLATIGSAEDREVALNLCRESVTLLENPNNVCHFGPFFSLPFSSPPFSKHHQLKPTQTTNNKKKQLLPLSISKYPRILVTGPSSDSLTNQCGGWTVNWQGAPSDDYFSFGTTVLRGVQGTFSPHIF